MTLPWLFLAGALVLAGGDRSARPVRRRRSPKRRPPSPRTLQWLAAGAVGVGCVAALGPGQGVLAGAAGIPLAVLVVAHVHGRPRRVAVSASLALALDLVALALRAGQPLSVALTAAAPAADAPCRDRLVQVGGLLRLGAEPSQAWRVVADDSVLAPVAAAAVRSAVSGVRLAAAFEELADEMRGQVRAAAEVRAHRVGVLAAAPLGLCFLPSFVCLGIVPTVIGIAHGALGS